MQKFWPENVDTIYKSHKALLISLINNKNFNDVINVTKKLELVFNELTLEMHEGELKNNLSSLNEKVTKLKEAASFKNKRLTNQALNVLNDCYLKKAG